MIKYQLGIGWLHDRKGLVSKDYFYLQHVCVYQTDAKVCGDDPAIYVTNYL